MFEKRIKKINLSITPGFEPGIPRSVGGCLNHWAMRPLAKIDNFLWSRIEKISFGKTEFDIYCIRPFHLVDRVEKSSEKKRICKIIRLSDNVANGVFSLFFSLLYL